MAVDNEHTSFLLRGVPKDLWGRVKHKAYTEGVSVREYIFRLLTKDTQSWQVKKTEMEKLPNESSQST